MWRFELQNPISWVTASTQGSPSDFDDVARQLDLRMLKTQQDGADARLRDVVSRVVPTPKRHCGSSYLRVTGAAYGENSNMLLSIVHGIALADWVSSFNTNPSRSGSSSMYTLLLPHYVTSILFPFDLSSFTERFCVHILDRPREEDERLVSWTQRWFIGPLQSFIGVLTGAEQQAQEDKKHLQSLVQAAVKAGQMVLVPEPPSTPWDVQVTMSELFHLGSPNFLHVWHRLLSKSAAASASAMVDSSVSRETDRDGNYYIDELDPPPAAAAAPPAAAAAAAAAVARTRDNRGAGGADFAPLAAEPLAEGATYDTAGLLQKQRAARPQVARTYVGVVGSLWGAPAPFLRDAACRVVQRELGGALGYYAAHKRHLDGFCKHMMAEVSQIEVDFPEVSTYLQQHFDKHAVKEVGLGEQPHPICDMPPLLFQTIVNGKKKSKAAAAAGAVPSYVFVLSDGHTDYSNWHNFVEKNPTWRALLGYVATHAGVSISPFIDMYVASHAQNLFIGNPRSTFSFQIATLRAMLARQSWPETPRHDIYFAAPLQPEEQWISLRDIKEVIKAAVPEVWRSEYTDI